MTTIALPDQLPTMPALEATAGGVDAAGNDVRAAGTTTSDSWSTTSGKGIPGDWSGVTADSAGYAFTRFGTSCDEVTAALEKGSLALEVYSEQITDLTTERERLDGERTTFNWNVIGLKIRIDGAGADADVEALRSEAQRLFDRRDLLESDRQAWEDRVTAAEDRLIAALQSVDSDSEATDAANDPGRADVPALLAQLQAASGDPAAVNSWWESLTPAEREALKFHSPELVGNTDGIPIDDRDDANRSQLEKDEEYLTGKQDSGDDLSDEEEAQLANVQAALEAVENGEESIDPHTGLPLDTNLVLYQPLAYGGDGAVAVAYGNPDTADNTAVVVPGLTNDGTTIASQGEDALNLLNASDPSESTAVIAWMGYDAPSGSPGLDDLDVDVDANPFSGVDVNPFNGGFDLNPFSGVGVEVGIGGDLANLAGVTNEELATQGGENLSHFVDGLRATHEGERGNLAVIGHSYGSTTAAHGASDLGLDADSLTLLGSPGAGHNAPTAEDLGMPPGRVYVGSADNDPVTWLGDRDSDLGLGADPSQHDYGATRIGVDDGQSFHVDNLDQGLDNHTSYFDPRLNEESVTNLGAIISGDDPVTTEGGRTQEAREIARDYAESEADYWADRGREELEDRFVDPFVDFGTGVVETGQDAAEWTGDRVDDAADAAESAYDNTLGRLPGL